jgi:hypothetical protein
LLAACKTFTRINIPSFSPEVEDMKFNISLGVSILWRNPRFINFFEGRASFPNFKSKHDRDVNAAINIRSEGLRILALGTSATASGGKVSPYVGRRKSSVSKAHPSEAGSPIIL